jgi:F0F1-type ATP synthase membrane subunit b/b'
VRRVFWILAGWGISFCAFAQEAGHEGADSAERPLVWMWANFIILALVLGYLIRKSGGAFYRSRQEAIQNGISEAAKLKQDADARARGIEQRLAGLEQEIERMKASAKAEFAAEGKRIERETAQVLERLQTQTAQEIAAATKHAREELKSFAAGLTLDLAESRIRVEMTPEVDHRLVESFTHELAGRGGAGEATA